MEKAKRKISVVVPCYNEEKALAYFYEAVCRVAESMDFLNWEFKFVDDGSSDGTLNIIRDFALKDERVKYISFSRNFGKEAAMFAGLKEADGDFVAVMDADLQDPPERLREMYSYLESGEYDCAATRRVTRKGEPPIRSFFARAFYKVANKAFKFEIMDGARDFRLMTRKMVEAVVSVGEYNRFSKGIFAWVGFKTKWIEYENIERVAGETKWDFCKLVKYSFEGIAAFTTFPLLLSVFLGVFLCLAAVAVFICDIASGGLSAALGICALILLLSGVQLISLGILGQYFSKMYLEVKKRPVYIVRESEKDIK